MDLKQLLNQAGITANTDAKDITSLCCDSRSATPGCLFFALPGNREDGSKYAKDAIEKGAVAIICDAKNAPDIPEAIAVPNAREAMAKIAAAFYQNPSQKFYLCGITGTNGKTTTTYLLEQIWGAQKSGIIGTVNIRVAGDIQPATHTTPESIVVQKIFSEMSSAAVTAVAIEVSSHALEQDRVTGSAFDSAVFTNLTQDHLDYHGTMDDYFAAKKKLFNDVLANSKKNRRCAVINIDDPYGQKLFNDLKTTQIPCVSFGITNSNADVHVSHVEYSLAGISAELSWKGQKKNLTSNLLGAHNLSNLLGALIVGEHSGQTYAEMAEQLRQVSVPGRLQRVLSPNKPNFFVDYAHTPDALVNVLKALRAIMPNDGSSRLWTVFGCGGDRDRTKRPLMGKAVAELSDAVMVTSDNPRTEDPQKIIADILPGVSPHQKIFDGQKGYLVYIDRREALKRISELAEPGDVVLVAGKGHEDYQIIGTQKFPFDDAKILTELLK